MEAITALASACKAATAYDHVHKSECVYTFHTPLTNSGSGGLVVNLQTFVGTVLERALAPSNAGPALFLRIVQHRQRKAEMPSAATTAAPPTKLGLGVEGGFTSEEDKYEIISTYSVLVLERAASGETKVVTEVPYTTATSNDFPTSVAQSVDAIVHHVGVATQQDVAVWSMEEPDIPVSKYAADLPFVANGVVIDPDPKTWKCAASGATENLWLNLSDGYIGGGRQHWDGTGGSNGALDHFRAVQAEGGGFYPLVVKLGTITSDVSAADCYSYAPDEDGPVRVPNLAALLEQRGMRVHAGMRKTVKSTAELEVELNANYAFDAITEAGGALTPVSGPGQQGLQNLGNSCYMYVRCDAMLIVCEG
jgi:ubiquitin carboxyl-terminal hydrolase 5/13